MTDTDARQVPPGAPRSRAERRAAAAELGVEANARMTGITAALLLVLLAAEGATLLSIHQLIRPHVFLGLLLVPPVLVKLVTTTYRFVRYYTGTPAYVRKGPPPWILRLLGPVVAVLTIVVLGSGVALLFVPAHLQSITLLAHKASFVLWFGAMAIHVLGHLFDTGRLNLDEWRARTRHAVPRAGLRFAVLSLSVVTGLALAVALVGRTGHFVFVQH